MRTYPQSVTEFTEKVIETLKEIDFFEIEEVKEEVFYEICCESLLKKFLNGDDIIFRSEEEFTNVAKDSIIMTAAIGLQSKGLVDKIFDDEKDTNVYFLTQKGKEVAKDLGLDKQKENENN
jgi:hypothetical protein